MKAFQYFQYFMRNFNDFAFSMNTKRSSNKSPLFNSVKSVIAEATAALKGIEKDRDSSSARISFWNSIFQKKQCPIDTPIRQLFVDILLNHSIHLTNVQQFCFEMATLFIDLPSDFSRICGCFPYPYVTALHIAFRTLNELIENSPRESIQAFVEKAVSGLSSTKLSQLQAQIIALQSESLNLERIVLKIQNILPIETFDMFLQVLPPSLRLHFSLKFGRPYPKININFESILLPADFLQAVADIEGTNASLNMVSWTKDSSSTIQTVPGGV